MVYPTDSVQTIGGSDSVQMSRVRDMYTQSTSTINFAGFGSKITYFDASFTGYSVWGSVFLVPPEAYELSSWRPSAAGAWFKYSVGQSILTTGETGLPFSDPQSGEAIYGFSSYGFGGGGMSFGSITSPSGITYAGTYTRIRQIIYRPSNNKFYIRLSDYLNSSTPSPSFMNNSVYFYSFVGPTGGSYNTLSFSDDGADNTFEPTRIYSTTLGFHQSFGTAAIMLSV